MMFVCCHPSVSPDSQVSLILKTLCGFSIPEIAHAFLTSEENINKRLVRARKKIRQANLRLEMLHGEELRQRLDAVLQAIYLLFNEGYSASSGDQLIRYELCGEAIRLGEILATRPAISHKSNVFALLALMFFNASRFHARQDSQGNILSMEEQDRSLWNRELIRKGFFYISRIGEPGSVSVYHILAAISCQHCSSPDFASTDWKSILELYDNLILIDHSPVAILNRAIALSKVHGAAAGLRELDGIRQNAFLATYYLYFATQAEFYLETGEVGKAIAAYARAIELAPLKAEKELLEKKMSRFTAILPGA
jgi:RNA polymerase sigma-70 factor (ECF subfamily)